MIRYFERVLGLRSVSSSVLGSVGASVGAVTTVSTSVVSDVVPAVVLMDLDESSRPPSLEEMALRLRDAVAAEWLKVKGVSVDVQWLYPTSDITGARVVIAFGAGSGFHHEGCPVLLAPSLREMAGSPGLKRSGWLAIQSGLRRFC